MAGRYNAGSVDVKITLDSKEFEETIKKLKGQTKEIQEQMKTSSEASSSYINNLKKSVDDLKKGQQELYGSTSQTSKGLKEEAESIKHLSKVSEANVKNLDNTIKKNNELVKSNNKVKQEVDKLTASEKQLEKQTEKSASKLQQFFTQTLHDKVWQFGAKGSKGVFADGIRNQMKYIFGDMTPSEFDKRFAQALKDMGIKSRGTGSNQILDFGGYFKPNIEGVKELKKGLDEVASSAEKTTQSMKKLEKQTNFGMTNLEKAFTKSLFTEIGKYTPQHSGQNDLVIPLKPIFDTLEKEYMQYAKNMANFKKLWKVGLTATGTYLTKGTDRYGMDIVRFNEAEKGFSQINVTALKTKEEVKQAMSGIKTSVDKVTGSTEKAATATKELETAMLDLSGKTKYTYQQLWENFDKLPLKIQTALEGMNRAMYRSVTRLNYSPFSDEFANGLKAWGDLIPMLKSLPAKDITLPNNIDAHLEKYVHQVELLQKLFASRKSALEFNGGSASFDKIYIADLKKLKKELIETEIVSRKTGEAVKQLGASEEQTTTKTKKLTNETKQLVQSLKPITTETSLTDLKAASIDTLTQMIGKANAQAKQLSDNIKQLPVANDSTTQSAVRTLDIFKQINLTKEQQLALEKEIMRTMGAETYNYISNLKRGRTSTGVLGTDSALWKRYNGMTGRVKTFDYDKFVTHMQRIFKGILPEELYNEMWSKFSRRFKIGMVPPFQGQGGIKENYWKQLGYYEGVSSINELRESVQGLIGTTEELNAVEEQTAAQTSKWAEGTEAYKAQILGLGSAIRMYNGLGKRYKQTNEEIINSLTRMAEANEKVSGSAQKAYNHLTKLREIGYNFGFIGKDAEDTHFISSTLRAVKDMKITPKNPLIALFDEEDKEVLKNLSHFGKYGRTKDTPWTSPAKYWLKMPSKSQYAKDPYTEIPFVHDYTDMLEGDNFENAVKNAQTRIKRLLDWLNISLVKEAKGNIRVWNEELGKYELFGSLDFSNMRELPATMQEFRMELDKAIVPLKLITKEEANLAMRTTQLTYALKENVNWQERVKKDQAEALKRAKELAENNNKTSESIKKMGTVTVSTTSSVDDLGLGLETVAQEEKKVVRSTENVTNSLQKAITQANNLKGAINNSLRGYATDFEDMYFEQGGLALRKLYEANVLKYYNKINPSQWLKEVYEWGTKVENLDLSKFIGAYSDLTNFRFLGTWKDTNSILEAFKEVDEAVNKVAVDLEVINRVRIGDNWTVTLKSTGQAVKETVVTLDNFTSSADKVKEKEKELETGTKSVGETAKKAATEITQLVSAIQPITSNVSLSGLKDLTNKNLSENIRKAVTQANQLESVIKQINASANQTDNTLERVSRIRIGDNWKVKLIPTSFKEESSQATESIHKLEDEFKNFRNESSKTSRSVKRDWKNIFQQLKEMDEALWGTGSNMSSRDLRVYSFDKEGFETGSKVIANTTQALKTFDSTVITVAKHTQEMMENLRFKDEDGNVFGVDPDIIKEYDLFIKRYETLQQRMYNLSRGLGEWRNQGKVNTGYGKLLEDMGLLNMEGSLGRINVEGYSDYVARITEIKESLTGATTSSNTFKESLVGLATAIKENNNSLTGFVGKSEQAVKALTQMAEANERFKQATDPTKINQLIQRLEHFSSISEKNKRSLQNLSEQALILKDRFNVINNEFRSGMLSEEAYDKETKKLIADLERLGATATTEIRKLNTAEPTQLEKTNTAIKKGTASLNEFGKSMSNQEKYVDNLYRGLQKARSVIISMKTILRMMGGMATWNFAFELVESAKETYVAKNEMESLLNQNAKVNTSGINAYNKALDETARKFQKINKYSLGETGAAIGLEFNLNAQQMAKSLDVIAMVQSEYVRAGRTTEEASLAVKDILQGEFMRLSRETGVGKDDLIEKYGWNGDNTDVMNLMTALEKAGKERHWDVFAAKATSLNDVLTITQSRFSELGAEIATHAEPLILGAFNTILDAVEGLKKGFEGLGSEGKTFAIGGATIAGVYGLATAYLMLAKNMGALDIATLGFKDSMASAILQLDKSDVAMYGLRKTLLANLSGTEASTIANTGFTKSLVGRVLGVNQTALAERGLKNAMVESISQLKEGKKVTEDTIQLTKVMNNAKKEGISLEKASILTKDKSGIITTELTNKELTRSQRLAYMTTNMKYAEVAELSRGKAILKTATSWQVLRTAMLGVTSIAIIGWLASVYAWTDKVKKNVEGFYNVVDNGESLLKEAQNAVDSNSKSLEDVNAQIEKRKANNQKYSDLLREQNGLLEDQKTAQTNLYNTQKAVDLAKVKSERLQDLRSRIDTHHTTQLADAYIKLGNNTADAQLKANNLYSEVRVGSYYAEKALEKYDETLTNGVYHSLAHAEALKKQGVDQDKLNQYMADYNLITEEVAENWRKFNEGDIWAGVSAITGQLKQAWTDFMVTPEADTLFGALGRFVTWITPSVKTLIQYLEELGKWAINGFAWLTKSDLGNASLAIGGLVTGVGLLIWKFKDSIVSIKDFGKAIVNRIKDLKNLKQASEETSDVLGGDKSTGGITGEKTPTQYGDWKEWRGTVKQDFMANARSFLDNATKIAMAMGYLTVAIATLSAPMLALALEGELFKRIEPQVRKGIEGLQLIAPTIIAFLIPSMALMAVMSKFKVSSAQLTEGFKTSAQGIALGIILVTEALVLLNAPLISLGILGSVYQGLGDSVDNGIKAIKTTTDALYALVPWIPVFVAGIALAAITFGTGGVGGIAIGVVAAGIAVGVLAVAEAIAVMQAPLKAIEQIGNSYPNLSGVEQGAKALKVNAEALGYVDSALTDLVHIQWEDIKSRAMSLTGISLDTSLNDLVKEGGFFTQLNTFMTNLNSLEIVAPLPEKVEALNGVAEGIGTIDEAIKNVKSAMENLPNEFKNGGNGTPALSYDMNSDTTSVTGSATDDSSGYFEQFKEPLKQLKTFIDDFNKSNDFKFENPDTGRIEAISKAADMVTQINDAVNKVKEAMGNIAWGNVNTNVAQATGGGIPAFGGLGALVSLGADAYGAITGSNGAGDYQSSIGGQLHEMELVIKDLITFSNNISGAGNGGGAFGSGTNTDALTQMVTTVSDAITKLNDTLAQAVPQIKQNATNIGSGIKEGIKTGMGSLAGLIVTPLVAELQSAKANAGTYGKGTGWSFTNGFKIELKVKSATETEIGSTLTYLDGKKQDFYNKGNALGKSLSDGYKDGQDMHSPGIIARSTEEELGRVGTYFDEAIFALPQKAIELGDALSSNFNPQLAMGGLSADELTDFQSGLDTIQSMSNTTSLQTSTDFTNMSTSVSSNMANISTNVGGTFNSINQNATTSYAQLTNTTRTALNNMQSQTTKNIQGIKSSWRDMQTALIQSAENIRSETGSKIKSLESNMASFWNKVQNPANLLGGAGNPFAAQHSIRRRTSPNKSRIGFAGSGTNMGISSKFKPQKSKTDPSIFAKLFEIIGSDFPMYAGGGWSFNWSDDIRRTLLQWRTHFGEIYDNHLTVGKFENDDFPVRGIAEIAKNYIYDAISRTHYVGYFDSRYGDDPLAAWNAGGFNCWDGTNVVLALASAFGFSGSRVHGSWDGVPHVWARIPGLGDIDATAIQQGYGFTASKVRGAGSVSPAYTNPDSGTTNNYNGDVNIHIHTDGNNVEVDDRKIDSETGRKIIDLLGINPSTGR